MKDYLINYITFDQLMDSVRDDLRVYDTENMIDNSQYIKVVQTINRKLGIKLNKEKEHIGEVRNFKMKLPDDFMLLNFGLLCYEWHHTAPNYSGRHSENCGTACKNTCVELCNDHSGVPFIVHRTPEQTTYCTHFDVVRIKATSRVMYDGHSFNLCSKSRNEITIQGGYIYTNFEEGTLYIDYIGDLVDEENNLLLLDHPLVTDYYEYAVKRRILENLYIDRNEDVIQKINLVEQRYGEAKRMAHKLVNTPEFTELQQIWIKNRKDYYNRYYKPIMGRWQS